MIAGLRIGREFADKCVIESPRRKRSLGRKAGDVTGYDYSSAVKSSRIVWTAPALDRWLADPEKTIPGQKMNYTVPDAQDRADLIAWLEKN